MAPATLRSQGLLDETSGTSPPSPQENTINERLLKHMERMEAKMDTMAKSNGPIRTAYQLNIASALTIS